MLLESPEGLLVIKLGGLAATQEETTRALARELLQRAQAGGQTLMVHGGGAAISEVQRRYGWEPRFVEGIRQTTPREMPLIDGVLAGGVNKGLVRLLGSLGLRAWGLSGADGGVIRAESLGKGDGSNRTGRLSAVDPQPLRLLLDHHFLPVLAPPSTNAQGLGINVNADEAALGTAAALGAGHLLFLSDVPGVLEEGRVLSHLSPREAGSKKRDGTITGGMIPKIDSALEALRQGVGEITIGNYQEPGDLARLLGGSRGTRIKGNTL